MPKAHLDTQGRTCGATTTVKNQSSVTVGGLLWAIKDTTNSHGGGGLIPSVTDVTIEGSLVIIHAPDNANPDNDCPIPPDHCNPYTTEGFADVTVYG